MIRNQNAFTNRQIQFLESIKNKIDEINDPDPEIITHESYEIYNELTKAFGKIPKIKFMPHSVQIKAEIVRNAGLINEKRNQEIEKIRKKCGITSSRDKESRILARLFESEWNNIMYKAKKAANVLALINNFFAGEEVIAPPIELIQGILFEEKSFGLNSIKNSESSSKSFKTAENNGIRPYDQQLADLE